MPTWWTIFIVPSSNWIVCQCEGEVMLVRREREPHTLLEAPESRIHRLWASEIQREESVRAKSGKYAALTGVSLEPIDFYFMKHLISCWTRSKIEEESWNNEEEA